MATTEIPDYVLPRDCYGVHFKVGSSVAFWTGQQMAVGQVTRVDERKARRFGWAAWPIWVDNYEGGSMKLADCRKSAVVINL